MGSFSETFWSSCNSAPWEATSGRENVSPNERLVSMVAGVIVATHVLRRASLGSLLGSALAAGLVYRSITGHCHVKEAIERSGLGRLGGWSDEGGRSSNWDVDMESDQSFPASDPPSWSGVTS